MSLDAFGNVTNAADTAGNSWQFSYTANSILTNEVFTSLRLCASARETNALSRQIDAYSRPAGYDLAINNTPRSRVRYGLEVADFSDLPFGKEPNIYDLKIYYFSTCQKGK